MVVLAVLAYDDMSDMERGARLLKALAYPLRLSIVLHLREGELCVHDLVERVGAAQPLVSQHLTVLKSAGVIAGRRQGREIVYRLTDEHISHIVLDALTHASEGGVA
jgi:DNA-binding transcriptional ArsR family regulator